MLRVTQAVQEQAEELVAKANLPKESLRYESLYGRGLRVIAKRYANVRVNCGIILVYKTPEGVWDLAENEPAKPEMSERDRRWKA